MVKGKKHLDLVKRANLESGLKDNKSLKSMGKEFGVSTSTLSREITKHTYDVFEFIHGEGNAARLAIAKINPTEVVLKPRLLGIEVK